MLLGNDATSAEEAEAPEGFALPSLGTVIDGRYRITRSIGAGGMGAVFEAEQLAVGRRCALKFLRAELIGRSRSASRFRREARLLGKLEHEHLTAVLDYGAYLGKSPFLVMEYLEGRTLKQVFEQEAPLPLDRALEILLQVARGMAYVHRQQVVHRDLKPANLMLLARSDERPWVKILDFGIARGWQELGGQLTPSGAELGTAHYMSPEQARGAKRVDPRSDVYALGAIAYEALTGARVHPGDSYNEVIFHLLTQPHRPLREVAPTCPAPVQAMVERCLEKDPEGRYVDAGELADELAQLCLQTGDERRPDAATPRHRSVRGRGARARWLVTGALLGSGMTSAVGVLTMRDGTPGSSGNAGSLQYASPSVKDAEHPAIRASLLARGPGLPSEPPTAAPAPEANSAPSASASPTVEAVAPGTSTEGGSLLRSRRGTAPVAPQPARAEPPQETSGHRGAPTSAESASNPATVPAPVASSSPAGSPRFLTSNPYGAN